MLNSGVCPPFPILCVASLIFCKVLLFIVDGAAIEKTRLEEKQRGHPIPSCKVPGKSILCCLFWCYTSHSTTILCIIVLYCFVDLLLGISLPKSPNLILQESRKKKTFIAIISNLFHFVYFLFPLLFLIN